MASLFPPIKWAQRKDRIFLTIEARDIKNEQINLTEKTLTFSGESDSQKYEATINFFADLETEVSKWNKGGLNLQFVLVKKDKSTTYWKRLTLEDKKNQNISVDWSKYIDEDEEDEEGNKGLGGGDWDPSAMNNFGGPEEGDSDEENDQKVDDLEKEEELPAGEHKEEEKKCEEGCSPALKTIK